MQLQGKVWGQTSVIFEANNVSVNRIVGKRGGYCSKHMHAHKMSMFFVESGQLLVSVWKRDYELVDETPLCATESTIIKPGEYHKFEILEDDTVAYEIYWVELDTSDIVREGHGGIEEPKDQNECNNRQNAE